MPLRPWRRRSASHASVHAVSTGSPRSPGRLPASRSTSGYVAATARHVKPDRTHVASARFDIDGDYTGLASKHHKCASCRTRSLSLFVDALAERIDAKRQPQVRIALYLIDLFVK